MKISYSSAARACPRRAGFRISGAWILYHQKYDVPPETILSHSYFLRYPEKFYAFYRDKMLPVGAKPNAAHKKLAELEAAGKLKAVVTQNIDGLHQAVRKQSRV